MLSSATAEIIVITQMYMCLLASDLLDNFQTHLPIYILSVTLQLLEYSKIAMKTLTDPEILSWRVFYHL